MGALLQSDSNAHQVKYGDECPSRRTKSQVIRKREEKSDEVNNRQPSQKENWQRTARPHRSISPVFLRTAPPTHPVQEANLPTHPRLTKGSNYPRRRIYFLDNHIVFGACRSSFFGPLLVCSGRDIPRLTCRIFLSSLYGALVSHLVACVNRITPRGSASYAGAV